MTKVRLQSKNKFYKVIFYLLLLMFLFYIFKPSFFAIASDFFSFSEKFNIAFSDKKKLISEKNSLEKKLELLEKESDILSFYIKENQDLKERVDYRAFGGFSGGRIYDVYTASNESFYSSFFIDDVEKELSPGDLVFSKYNLLLGEIDEVYSGLAKFSVYSSYGKKSDLDLYHGGEFVLGVEALGKGSGILEISLPREIDFSIGDVFLASPKSPSYLVAYRVDEKFNVQDPNKKVYFKIYVSPEKLKRVEVYAGSGDKKN